MNTPIENCSAWVYRLVLAFFFYDMIKLYFEDRKKAKNAIACEKISKILKEKYSVDVTLDIISNEKNEDKKNE